MHNNITIIFVLSQIPIICSADFARSILRKNHNMYMARSPLLRPSLPVASTLQHSNDVSKKYTECHVYVVKHAHMCPMTCSVSILGVTANIFTVCTPKHVVHGNQRTQNVKK